jgi:hypothetical protein
MCLTQMLHPTPAMGSSLRIPPTPYQLVFLPPTRLRLPRATRTLATTSQSLSAPLSPRRSWTLIPSRLFRRTPRRDTLKHTLRAALPLTLVTASLKRTRLLAPRVGPEVTNLSLPLLPISRINPRTLTRRKLPSTRPPRQSP